MYKLSKLRLFAFLFVVIFSISAFKISSFAKFESSAGSAFLMESSTGKILYEKNADTSVPPASITKLMTLLLGFEAVDNGKAKWDDLIPISEKAWRMGGSKMFLEVGNKVKYEDIITGISVVSANDGCVALAEYLYGSEDAFVDVMNQRAKEIGLKNTQFKNSTGLPAEGHVMSAKDIASLAKFLIDKFPQILDIESKREYTYNNILQQNRNPLLGVFPGADGLKTGWTDEAGYCLVGTAKQNDMRVISVILNTSDEQQRLTASTELLTYGFKNFQYVKVKNNGDLVGNMDVENGKTKSVPVKIKNDISVVLPSMSKDDVKNIEYTILKNANSINAPVSEDVLVGTLEVRFNGETLATSEVYTAQSVSKEGFFKRFLNMIGSLFGRIF